MRDEGAEVYISQVTDNVKVTQYPRQAISSRVAYLVLGPASWVLCSQNRLDVSNRKNEVGLAEHSQPWNHPTTQPLEEREGAAEVQQWNILLL